MSGFSVFRAFTRLLLAGGAVVALASCGVGHDKPATNSAELVAPPPGMAVAGPKGLSEGVYYDAELRDAMTKLDGMKVQLDGLQGDLQASTQAMQRVAAMRDELDSLDARFKALQARMGGQDGSGASATASVTESTTVPMTLESATMPSALNVVGLDTQAPVPVSASTPIQAGPQDLVGRMPESVGAKAANAPVTAGMKPVVDEKAKTPVNTAPAKAAPAAPVKGGVSGVRIGTHENSVRIVLDVAGDAFSSELDSANHILTIELPKAKWAAVKAQAISANPVVASYSAQDAGTGSVVAFALKKDSKVLTSSALKSVDSKPARIVIDLAK